MLINTIKLCLEEYECYPITNKVIMLYKRSMALFKFLFVNILIFKVTCRVDVLFKMIDELVYVLIRSFFVSHMIESHIGVWKISHWIAIISFLGYSFHSIPFSLYINIYIYIIYIKNIF